jgi:hypothetical protein
MFWAEVRQNLGSKTLEDEIGIRKDWKIVSVPAKKGPPIGEILMATCDCESCDKECPIRQKPFRAKAEKTSSSTGFVM